MIGLTCDCGLWPNVFYVNKKKTEKTQNGNINRHYTDSTATYECCVCVVQQRLEAARDKTKINTPWGNIKLSVGKQWREKLYSIFIQHEYRMKIYELCGLCSVYGNVSGYQLKCEQNYLNTQYTHRRMGWNIRRTTNQFHISIHCCCCCCSIAVASSIPIRCFTHIFELINKIWATVTSLTYTEVGSVVRIRMECCMEFAIVYLWRVCTPRCMTPWVHLVFGLTFVICLLCYPHSRMQFHLFSRLASTNNLSSWKHKLMWNKYATIKCWRRARALARLLEFVFCIARNWHI